MDLERYDLAKQADEGNWITILNPFTGEPTDARIKVAGRDSKLFRKMVFDRLDRRARKSTPIGAEEQAEDTLWIIAQCTLEWEGITEGGSELHIDDKKSVVAQVYKKYFWIYEQVQEGMGVRKAEGGDVEGKSTPGSVGNSPSSTVAMA